MFEALLKHYMASHSSRMLLVEHFPEDTKRKSQRANEAIKQQLSGLVLYPKGPFYMAFVLRRVIAVLNLAVMRFSPKLSQLQQL